MKHHDEDMDARLTRLTAATERVAPRRDFSARVAGAVSAKPAVVAPSWVDDAVRSARRLVPIAALAAVLGVVWAVQSDRAYDDAFAASYGDVDGEW